MANELQKNSNEVVAGAHDADSLKRTRKNVSDDLIAGQIESSKKKTFYNVASDNEFIHWAPDHPDNARYLCEITLHEKTALYWYHGQCNYDYFTYITSDTTLEVLWSYRSDCILKMDFLEKSHDLKIYPKGGDLFATFSLANDTTINVRYHFPAWRRKVNLIAKDSIFPTTYYLIGHK